VAIVTDSTACLAAELAEGWRIRVVPLGVVVAGQVHDDIPGLGGKVSAALRRGAPLSTTRPAPARFAAAYAAAAADGAVGIVSVHLSGRVSGTVDSARLAARDAPVPVHVVDSRCVGAGLGFAAVSAAGAARAGLPLDDVAEAAARRSAGLRSVFCVTSLEHLRHGGRVRGSRPDAALGAKVLLHIADGQVVPLEKVRTVAMALARLEQLAVGYAACAGGAPVDIAVQHLDGGERADQLAQRLRAVVPGVRGVAVSEVGPVIGAHTGPGMLGVVVAPDSPGGQGPPGPSAKPVVRPGS
jgi:fatty acid kinase fatty acid binding subunit